MILRLLRLGIRLFNTSAAATKLARCGYYQPAFTMVRDLMETELLLDLFSRKRVHLTDWRTLPDRERMKRFTPAKVRTILDDLDGFVERKRERAYSILSSYAAHPTPEGWVVISPDNMTQMGPFSDAGRLSGCDRGGRSPPSRRRDQFVQMPGRATARSRRSENSLRREVRCVVQHIRTKICRPIRADNSLAPIPSSYRRLVLQPSAWSAGGNRFGGPGLGGPV